MMMRAGMLMKTLQATTEVLVVMLLMHVHLRSVRGCCLEAHCHLLLMEMLGVEMQVVLMAMTMVMVTRKGRGGLD